MEGTLDFDSFGLEANVYFFFLHYQCPRSKLSEFRIMPYSQILVRGQNL